MLGFTQFHRVSSVECILIFLVWRVFFFVCDVFNPCKRGRNPSPHKIQACVSITQSFEGLFVIFGKAPPIKLMKVIQHVEDSRFIFLPLSVPTLMFVFFLCILHCLLLF